ncbi:PcfK-like family protein [Flavobacterium sp. N502540]|uniref:PcfK-like family protein n=1 Tax=Flavobacterium sp. N502540 TaxID=2986838 RepID=UPI0022241ECD|nr:PcfK-like family protein [Flavobacterium sp. N502540]
MNGSEKFKTRIEVFLKEKALSDALFSPMLEKPSKNLESCLTYIIAEVKKTGLCAFDDSEIFDMTVKYYTDDTIGTPPEIKCRVVTDQPKQADLFSVPSPVAENAAEKIPSQETRLAVPALKEIPKTAQTALTLFDL